jgi:hypothetical protein
MDPVRGADNQVGGIRLSQRNGLVNHMVKNMVKNMVKDMVIEPCSMQSAIVLRPPIEGSAPEPERSGQRTGFKRQASSTGQNLVRFVGQAQG